MIKYVLFLFSLFFISCLTAPADQNKNSSIPVVTPGEPVSSEEVQNLRTIKELPPWVFDSTPYQGYPRIVVFTDRIGDKTYARTLAEQMAALDAVKMKGVYVSSKTLAQEGDYNFGFAANVKIDYLKEQAPSYLEKLELEKILHTPMGTVARFYYKGDSTSLEYKLQEEMRGRPDWITKQPELEGYTLAIGSADRHRSWGSSFAAADENAIANLAVTLYGRLKSIKDTEESYRRNNSQLAMLETIFVSGEGILRDTMIIARWVDDNEKQFYSLAAIPVAPVFK